MSEIYRVKCPGGRTVEFCNATAASSYATKWGGQIMSNEDPGKGKAIDPGTSDNCPVPSPGLATLLGLPADAAVNSPDLVRLAWKANGKKSAPRNTQAIATALVDYFATKRGLSRDAAEKHVRDTCPLLFKSELAKTAGTASNERRMAGNEIIHTANEGIFLGLGPTVETML